MQSNLRTLDLTLMKIALTHDKVIELNKYWSLRFLNPLALKFIAYFLPRGGSFTCYYDIDDKTCKKGQRVLVEYITDLFCLHPNKTNMVGISN